jgi:ankyrin repeat protein
MNKITAIATALLMLCMGCASNSARVAAAQKKAQDVMQKIGAAWDEACRSGNTQTVRATGVESVVVFQGRVRTAGNTNLHTLSGSDLKDMQRNIAILRPESPAAVSILADREEFKGSFSVACTLHVSAMTLEGDTITITPSGSQALVMSASKGDAQSIENLVSKGADVNAQDQISPLMAAADSGQVSTVALLLKKGARVNDRAALNGMTALHFAARKGFLEVVELLLKSGADFEITDSDGFTPLWSAAFMNQEKSLDLLLKKGASINHLDKNGNNIIAPAAVNGSNNVIKLLVTRGVDPRHKNKFQRTALFDAIENNKPDTVRLLLSYKVDINGQTTSGKTPLSVARQAGFTDIVQILEEGGAK